MCLLKLKLRAKVDGNQKAIVLDARKAGYQVHHLHQMGNGWPDTLWCKNSQMWFVEIKVPKGKLTPRQIEFMEKWKGPPIIVGTSFEEIERTISSLSQAASEAQQALTESDLE